MIGDVMRGDPPAGIKAGVALQYLAEQEAQQQNAQVANYNDFVRRVTQKRLSVAGQYYDKSDKRTILVLGHNKDWVSMNFDPEKLARPFDIRIQNTSALPDSKAARTQYILDVSERFPGLFPEEQVAEMLDLGQVEKFMDEAASAARSAEYENEKILDGEAVGAPEDWEMHIVHWRIHVRSIQDPVFKAKTPKPIQDEMKAHILATEMLMEKAAQKSPSFAQQLTALPQWPIFWTPQAPPPPPMPEDGAMPQDPDAMDPGMAPPPQISADQMPPDQLPMEQHQDVLQPVGETLTPY